MTEDYSLKTRTIRISIARQTLELREEEKIILSAPVSTGLNGVGEQQNSGKTPRGRFTIRIKIGAGCAENQVFVERRPTGEIYSLKLAEQFPHRDWILTRILWLTGTESGKNRGGRVDTLRRFIYIHGTPESEPMGIPCSHGCVRIRNCDLIALFNLVQNGTEVFIHES